MHFDFWKTLFYNRPISQKKEGAISLMHTVKMVAFLLDIDISLVYKWEKRGVAVPIYEIGGLKVIYKRDLQAYLSLAQGRKCLEKRFCFVQAVKNGERVWSGYRRGSIEQVKEGLQIYPSLRNCRLFIRPLEREERTINLQAL